MAVISRPPKTETSKKQVYYSDVSTAFSIHPNKRDVTLTFNEDSVKQSLRNIILTSRGERFFNPLFGCGLNYYLFEPITPHTQEQIRIEIETSIKRYEPRAELIDVIVSPYPDENGYVISVLFNTINTQTPSVLELLVSRIR